MVQSDDVYFYKSGEKLSVEILGHARWAKIRLWNDDWTYSAAAPLQWPKMSIFGLFWTFMGSIKEQILMQWIWYILMKFILISLVKNSAVKSSVTRGEWRSGFETMMGHTYSAAAPLQWPKVSIFGIFCTYMDTIKEQILMEWIWYIPQCFRMHL